jgi:hypothetical protein
VKDPLFSNTPIQDVLERDTAERTLSQRPMLRREVTALDIHMMT